MIFILAKIWNQVFSFSKNRFRFHASFLIKQELNWKPHAKVFAPLQFSRYNCCLLMIAVWVPQMIASERVEALKLYQLLGHENFLNSKKKDFEHPLVKALLTFKDNNCRIWFHLRFQLRNLFYSFLLYFFHFGKKEHTSSNHEKNFFCRKIQFKKVVLA